ncbi:DUF1194 domain-containing protein [Cochlodiniinecator piscidefendens]|uniref:DUF1194 domain-containing protein n=1 Tax=Cochlodiniinecator piscidefendens TaxID=2715756 RepID=UPI002F407630
MINKVVSAVVLSLIATSAAATCRQALLLGLDVSGSVDAREYRLQLDGLANAFDTPSVRSALLSFPAAPVSIGVFEWSGATRQRLLVPWTSISSTEDLNDLISVLHSAQRVPLGQSTALGSAMAFAANYLEQQSECWSKTLDISGDGPSNSGPRPRDIAQHSSYDSITINALVIGSDPNWGTDQRSEQIGELKAYFESEVIRGPIAFVEVALGFEDYEEAMIRKLLRELEGLVLSQL